MLQLSIKLPNLACHIVQSRRTFRGEIGVILINLGTMPFRIDPGMRIAQLVMSKFETINWQVVDELPTSERGEKGFGSSGVK